ncbi:MAG: hypothetical protein ACLT09_07250 [Flavonifractor plautii]
MTSRKAKNQSAYPCPAWRMCRGLRLPLCFCWNRLRTIDRRSGSVVTLGSISKEKMLEIDTALAISVGLRSLA